MKKLLLSFIFSFSSLFSDTFVYECDHNKNFVIQMLKEKAWLFSKDETMALSLVPSASGLKYEKEGRVFFQKGYEASLDTPATQYRGCSNNRQKAIWEDSKLRGNDFRAVGNEPGWYLEIADKGAKALLVTEYGDERYELSFPRPFSSKRVTRYRIKGFADVIIEGKKCRDSMTGEFFHSRVKVKINGKVYRGCGKALH